MRLIDADKLVKDIWNTYKGQAKENVDMALIGDIIIKATEQPTINQWIPCSERLPKFPKDNPNFENKPLELYLVSTEYETYPFRAFWNGKTFTDGFSKCDVIAWMPLPAPYKESE